MTGVLLEIDAVDRYAGNDLWSDVDEGEGLRFGCGRYLFMHKRGCDVRLGDWWSCIGAGEGLDWGWGGSGLMLVWVRTSVGVGKGVGRGGRRSIPRRDRMNSPVGREPRLHRTASSKTGYTAMTELRSTF